MVMPVLAAAAPFIGSAISGIASLIGGRKSSKAAGDAAMANYIAQKEFAQNGIRWRVEDAKAAGLHPLFALSGGGATFSPSFTVGGEGAGIADAGQHLGRAVTAALQPSERALQAAQLRSLQAQANRDDAQAMLFASQAARARQEANQSAPIDITPGFQVDTEVAGQGLVFSDTGQGVPLPPEAPPFTSWVSAKPVQSAWDRYQVAPNAQMLLPAGGSMSEALESVSEGLLLGALIVGMNARHYGPGWLTAMADHTGVPLRKFQEALDRFNSLAQVGGLPRWTSSFGVK